MTPLTENKIKQIALAYLRHYYRYRPRTEGETSFASLDNQLEGGITVDAMLLFCPPEIVGPFSHKKKEEQKVFELITQNQCHFIATCEATSRREKEELYYHFDTPLWLLDSLAFGLFLTTGFFIYAEVAPLWFPDFLQPLLRPFEEHQAGLLTLLAFLLTLLGTASGALISRSNKRFNIRYRYIYALRQFQQYFAHEKWAAFSIDVFRETDPKTGKEIYWKENKYYKELYRQALNAGVGLLAIDEKESVTPIITPSRKSDKIRENTKMSIWKKLKHSTPLQKAKQKTNTIASQATAHIPIDRFHHARSAPSFLTLLLASILFLIIRGHYLQRPGPREISHAKVLENWQEQKTLPIDPAELQRQRLILPAFIDTPFWPVALPFLFDTTRYIDPIVLEIRKRKQEGRILVPIIPPPEDTTAAEEFGLRKPPDSGD